MSNKPARRELGFVLAVACAGLVAVLVVAFAPWYPVGPAPPAGSGVQQQIVRLVGGEDASTSLRP
jgi:hypothetical protein